MLDQPEMTSIETGGRSELVKRTGNSIRNRSFTNWVFFWHIILVIFKGSKPLLPIIRRDNIHRAVADLPGKRPIHQNAVGYIMHSIHRLIPYQIEEQKKQTSSSNNNHLHSFHITIQPIFFFDFSLVLVLVSGLV